MDSVVTALLDAKADVTATDYELGNTALHEAVRKNRGGAVRDLLASKADPSAKNERRRTVAEMCSAPQVRAQIEEAVQKSAMEHTAGGGKKKQKQKQKKRGIPVTDLGFT